MWDDRSPLSVLQKSSCWEATLPVEKTATLSVLDQDSRAGETSEKTLEREDEMTHGDLKEGNELTGL